jgi:hypothetical protein
MRWTGV